MIPTLKLYISLNTTLLSQETHILEKIMNSTFKITNVNICTPHQIIYNGILIVKDGRILSAGSKDILSQNPEFSEIPEFHPSTQDISNCYVLPGFIDIHCHGASLFDFTSGMFDINKQSFCSKEKSWTIGLPGYARWKLHEGVTSFYMATLAAPIRLLRKCLQYLARYMQGETNGKEGAFVRGGFLEGCFFNPRMSGAQNTRYILKPEKEIFDEINESGAIRLVNVVPDYGEPSFKLIRELTSCGITVGAGHTDATADQFREAVKCGLKYVIHFTNGPTGGSYKPFNGGGVIEAALQTDEVYVEQICDMYHVNPAYIRDIIMRKGVDKVIAITDQTFVTGTNIRKFTLGGINGEVSSDGAYIGVVGKPNTLFGSCLTMDKAFSNLLSLLTRDMQGVWYRQHTAMPFDSAMLAATGMCSTNPAKMLGLLDDLNEGTGAIQSGKWADLLIAKIEGSPGSYRLKILDVFVRGNHLLSL